MRYFGQAPDYWLDTCTLDDWTNIWSRELRETPPVDDFAVMYFKYQSPEQPENIIADGHVEEWKCPYPEFTE